MAAATQVLEAAQKQIQKIVDTLVTAISDRALPYEEYQFVCGKIRGLRLANDEISGLLQNLKDQDDNDE